MQRTNPNTMLRASRYLQHYREAGRAMGNLILNSLEIRGFRGFRHLQIERLGRVNLIVGKNNVGKSSLLEALQLYAVRGSPALIWELLRVRDESRYSSEVRDERRLAIATREEIEVR